MRQKKKMAKICVSETSEQDSLSLKNWPCFTMIFSVLPIACLNACLTVLLRMRWLGKCRGSFSTCDQNQQEDYRTISGTSQVYLLLREQETRDFSTIQGKTVMRMTPEAFHTWSQRLQFSSETEALITFIRSSPPVRRVSGRANNVTRRYPSPKMGVSIQFESDHAWLARLS